jgi:hypothetical protein
LSYHFSLADVQALLERGPKKPNALDVRE